MYIHREEIIRCHLAFFSSDNIFQHVVVALGDGEGSTSQSYVLIRDTDITSNVGVSEDFISRRDVIVMSQEFGASIEMIRNQFQDNTNFLVSIFEYFPIDKPLIPDDAILTLFNNGIS